MQFEKTLVAVTLLAVSKAAAVPDEPYTTLTPTGVYKDASSNYPSTFGINVVPLAAANAKRDYKVQHKVVVTRTHDVTVTVKGEPTTVTTKVDTTTTVGAGAANTEGTQKSTVEAIDTEVQATQKPAEDTVKTDTQKPTAKVTVPQKVEETSTSKTESKPTTTVTDQKTSNKDTKTSDNTLNAVSCKNSGTLVVSLTDGLLIDSKGRIGSVVSNRQIQFDGPPPQSGSIYAAGWALTPDGNLALGSQDIFYQCLSGNFYNMYDQPIAEQCEEVHLQAIELVDC
ncbi:hypothetical protein TBLA_0A06230 [Henningerozyma blattae CBS 6284]|uniref:Cell wall mannoprotein PIR1-like C-terminal domain-containing protein n=1 Tax=Henningerozyma blattae (strain ATCC 34711 / CBS 6284 / DSM 70876 / NBRC 10599 / NRRL Y-10934 / UCD 77-7) TaxID=1071380 RepID=I2GWB3_HENB6|nr:hypothetical protein TBLA_0A06230 [Tetrapisispora blattae CBS 6284]CCH58415.1 hypothetical protein TBLA_0A06230 [Tetrapisispora blattae CBS 6284]